LLGEIVQKPSKDFFRKHLKPKRNELGNATKV
jgi:hypothetical protein